MAKLAIALCFLLVACGVQGSWWSDVQAEAEKLINDAINELKEKWEAVKEQLEAAQESATAIVNEIVAKITEQVQAAIAEYDERKAALEATVENVSSCVSSQVNWTATTDEIEANAIACIKTEITTLASDYQTLNTSLYALADEMSAMSTSAKACVADTTTLAQKEAAAKCLYALVKSDVSEVGTELDNLVSSASKLIADLSDLRETLVACITDAAASGFSSYATAVAAAAKECAAAASTTSTDSSS